MGMRLLSLRECKLGAGAMVASGQVQTTFWGLTSQGHCAVEFTARGVVPGVHRALFCRKTFPIACSCNHRPSQQPISNYTDEPSRDKDPDEASNHDQPEVFTDIPPLSVSIFEEFSRLPDVAWDLDSVVTFMVAYLSILHIPLGLGGLSLVAAQLNTNELAPQTKALSLVIFQLLELWGTIWLINLSMKQSKCSFRCLNVDVESASGTRGWMATTIAGLAVILIAMGVTSCIKNSFMTEGKGEVIRQMVSGNSITKLSTFLVCCILTPCLEEIVYRGYLLQSLATRFGWQRAVIVEIIAYHECSGRE